MREIYGHEQQHVAEKVQSVGAIIDEVEGKNGGRFNSEGACQASMREWETQIYNRFIQLFPTENRVTDRSHDDDWGDEDDPRPGDGEPFPPLPDSPYGPGF